MDLYFSDVFRVSKKSLDDYGAFNIALVTDIPLFIDPFLLFCGPKKAYKTLHDSIIKYLLFLQSKSKAKTKSKGSLLSWFYFPEVKQTWLGFTLHGNMGRGLGKKFATALKTNFAKGSASSVSSTVAKGIHLEKLCLVEKGIDRDMISDFTTNLVKWYLLKYTEAFAKEHIAPKYVKKRQVDKAWFDYATERWEPGEYTLPFCNGDYVILTPKDILTKDEVWIRGSDYLDDFPMVIELVTDRKLYTKVKAHYDSLFSTKPTKEELNTSIMDFTEKHPELFDYYIKYKETDCKQARKISSGKVDDARQLYVEQFGSLARLLSSTPFYALSANTPRGVYERIKFLKDVIENRRGWEYLYLRGKPIGREEDLEVLYGLIWLEVSSGVSHGVSTGGATTSLEIPSRGEVVVKFKLASNPWLRQNLKNQVAIYKKTSDAEVSYTVIFYFTDAELYRVRNILKELGLTHDKSVTLIDARKK